ncbi:hypothetical protein ACIKTA_07240, partial [Hansschlegelia beijingensis]
EAFDQPLIALRIRHSVPRPSLFVPHRVPGRSAREAPRRVDNWRAPAHDAGRTMKDGERNA